MEPDKMPENDMVRFLAETKPPKLKKEDHLISQMHSFFLELYRQERLYRHSDGETTPTGDFNDFMDALEPIVVRAAKLRLMIPAPLGIGELPPSEA